MRVEQVLDDVCQALFAAKLDLLSELSFLVEGNELLLEFLVEVVVVLFVVAVAFVVLALGRLVCWLLECLTAELLLELLDVHAKDLLVAELLYLVERLQICDHVQTRLDLVLDDLILVLVLTQAVVIRVRLVVAQQAVSDLVVGPKLVFLMLVVVRWLLGLLVLSYQAVGLRQRRSLMQSLAAHLVVLGLELGVVDLEDFRVRLRLLRAREHRKPANLVSRCVELVSCLRKARTLLFTVQ